MSKTALVTGANRGIGRAIALMLAQTGHDLCLLARDEAALGAVADECAVSGVSVCSLHGELTDDGFMNAALETAITRYGAIDVLVNNAGTARHEAVQDADLGAWQDVMDVNFKAVVHLSAKVLPAMVARKEGTIVNISSISGRNSPAGSAIYSASKHALNGFSGSMFEDVRNHGIRVSTIMPGFVATDLTDGLGMDAGKMIQASDVADAVRYVLSASPSCCPTEIVLRPQLSL